MIEPMARGKYIPTDEHRDAAKRLASYGVKDSVIAGLMDISVDELYEHYSKDMAMAEINVNAQVTKALLDSCLDGNVTAQMFWIRSRMHWRDNDRTLNLAFSELETTKDVNKAMSLVAKAMASGTITPVEAKEVAAVIEAKRKTIETVELERRMAAIEERLAK